jgi:hypothetical protein
MLSRLEANCDGKENQLIRIRRLSSIIDEQLPGIGKQGGKVR